MLTVDDRVPDVQVSDQHGAAIDLTKGNVILYFYPKDDTPGCVKEACGFRDNYRAFKNARIYGVSVDDAEHHKKFIAKYSLPFPLIANGKELAKRMGVFGLVTAKRITFIIKNGTIEHVFESVTADGHALDVLAQLKELRME